jgi:hypothetical protein
MKNKNILFPLTLMTLLFLLTGLVACKSESKVESDGQTDFSLAIADSIVRHYNASRPEWDAALSTVGQVTIGLKEDHIELQHIGENVHEIMNYLLLTGDKKHKLEASVFGRAEVIYLDRAMLINSLERKQTLFFHIETDNTPEYVKDIKGIEVYGGYGLGLRKIAYGSQPDQAPYCGCQSSNVPPANCKSGGVMDMTCASSNEYGSCKVSCSGQTYACCDKENPQPQ